MIGDAGWYGTLPERFTVAGFQGAFTPANWSEKAANSDADVVFDAVRRVRFERDWYAGNGRIRSILPSVLGAIT